MTVTGNTVFDVLLGVVNKVETDSTLKADLKLNFQFLADGKNDTCYWIQT